MKSIIWFRRDLRLEDNRSFNLAEGEVLPIFIFDSNILNSLEREDKRVSYIHRQVVALREALLARGLDLAVFHGDPLEILSTLKAQGFSRFYASPDYDSYARARDKAANEIMEAHLINDTYIFEPTEVLKDDGAPYTVFTAYYNKSLKILHEGHYEKSPERPKRLAKFSMPAAPSLEALGFYPAPLTSAAEIPPQKALMQFKERILFYEKERNALSRSATSGFSIFLRFGTLGVRQVIRTLKAWQKEGLKVEPFFRQLIWREFYAQLLYHFPSCEHENFKPVSVPWQEDQEKLERWQKGECGIPLVDAGIRELNATGLMHNRARMVCASFLTKNLHIPWQAGERYFAQKLLDYDAAQNIGNWQWCAGTGADAQPFFRIFNPYTQSAKFDPDGEYVRKWVSELEGIPSTHWSNEERWEQLGHSRYRVPIVSAKASAAEAKALRIKAK